MSGAPAAKPAASKWMTVSDERDAGEDGVTDAALTQCAARALCIVAVAGPHCRRHLRLSVDRCRHRAARHSTRQPTLHHQRSAAGQGDGTVALSAFSVGADVLPACLSVCLSAGVYQIVFGLLILVAEARWSGLLKHFKFLTVSSKSYLAASFFSLSLLHLSDCLATPSWVSASFLSHCFSLFSLVLLLFFAQHFLGLGLFYVFVGGLVLGGAWYQYAEAILCLAVGSVYLLLGLACRTMAEPGFGGKPVEHSKYGEPGNKKPGQPDAAQDLKKKAAHMAVDHAIESGTNPFA